jgi:predicted metal-dependent RNase
VELVTERRRQAVIASDHPAIILASSGMLAGGVSPLYARRILQEERSALLLVGYQDAELLGRSLVAWPSAAGAEARR